MKTPSKAVRLSEAEPEAVRVVEIPAGEPTPLPPGCSRDGLPAAPKEIE